MTRKQRISIQFSVMDVGPYRNSVSPVPPLLQEGETGLNRNGNLLFHTVNRWCLI